MAKKLDLKAKAKRQKIVAAVLGVLLLGVLAYEVPSLMKTMNKKPPVSTAAAPPAPTAVPAVPGAAPTASATPVAAVTSGGTLVDSDPSPQAGGGQLVSFDRFPGKDPFAQQVGAKCDPDPTSLDASKCNAGPPPPAETPAKTPAKTPETKTEAPTQAPRQPTAGPNTARISVNGVTETVTVSESFPEADKVFVLRSLTNSTAKIGIAGGSLATGGESVTLTRGKKLTLMNTADGTRYELVLISVS